jgi:3-oxoacyl-[acyl-carrier protein] reductase
MTYHRLACGRRVGVVVNYAATQPRQKRSSTRSQRWGRALTTQADVANPEDVKQLFEKTIKAFGPSMSSSTTRHHAPLAYRQSDVDHSTRSLPQSAGNLPRPPRQRNTSQRGPRIIAFQQRPGEELPLRPVHCLKAGVKASTTSCNELRGHKITVNAIAPGPVGTELFLDGKTEEPIKQISSMAPLERLGQPDDIASVVSFLAGPDGGWVNAQVLRANGGFA